MINPIIIIVAVALLLSAFVVTLLNKPGLPIVASTFIIILIFFVLTTYLIDNAISNNSVSETLSSFVCFAVMNQSPSYEDLEAAFNIFKYTDIGLFLASVVSMLIEAMLILRQNSEL